MANIGGPVFVGPGYMNPDHQWQQPPTPGDAPSDNSSTNPGNSGGSVPNSPVDTVEVGNRNERSGSDHDTSTLTRGLQQNFGSSSTEGNGRNERSDNADRSKKS